MSWNVDFVHEFLKQKQRKEVDNEVRQVIITLVGLFNFYLWGVSIVSLRFSNLFELRQLTENVINSVTILHPYSLHTFTVTRKRG